MIGGFAGYAGGAIAGSGMVGANTAGIAVSSTMNSMGMNALSGGETGVSTSFGAISYNWSEGTVGYLGKKGNSTMENISYGLGALANVSDILAGFKPGSVELRTENDPNYSKVLDANGNPITNKDIIGHSQITDGKTPIIDWGPQTTPSGFTDWVAGTNTYEKGQIIPISKMKWSPINVKGVNTNRITNFGNSLTTNGGKYNIAVNSCVSMTSRALNMSGAFNIGIHPYLLNAQMYLRSIGARPFLFAYNLQK